MTGHLRADVIRLFGRWDVRGFLLVVPLLAVGGYLMSYAMVPGHYPADTGQPDQSWIASAIATERSAYAFPASLVAVSGNAPWLLFCLFFLASETMGLEFAWSTVKTSLISSPSRLRFVVSRLLVIGAIGFVSLVLLLVAAVVMPALMSIAGAGLPPSRPTDVVVIVGTVVALALASAFFIVVGVFLGVITRGPALPLVFLVADFIVEGVIAGLPLAREAGLGLLAGSLPIMSVINLISGAQDPRSYGLPPVLSDAPGAPSLFADRPLALSFLVVAVWAAVFLAASVWQLRRADVLE
ncbi:MAG TPA: hypothetical protein VIR16_08680 [Candidatus Limnocylindrales bacterium]